MNRIRFATITAIAMLVSQPLVALAQDALDPVLTQSWTKQDYIDGYANSLDAANPNWTNWVNSLASDTSVGRFDLARVKPAAALYRETGDSKYFDAAHAILTAAAANPPTDEEFSLGEIGYIYEQIKDSPLMPTSSKNSFETLIADVANISLTEEKGTAMNRGISNAIGLAYAAKLLPTHPDRQTWVNFHTDNWNNDMWRLRDTHENSGHYNMLFLPMLIKYVEVAGIDENTFYNDPNIKSMFTRYADIKTPLGINAAYGHALGVYDGLITPGTWEKLSEVYDDGRFKYLGQRALNARRLSDANYMNYDDVGMLVAIDYADDSVTPEMDADVPEVIYHERTLDGRKAPDKLVLSEGRDGVGTKLIMNFFDGGGHGAADGSAIAGLFYNNSPLLAGTPTVNSDEFEQQNNNLMLVRRVGETFAYSGETNLGDNQWHRVTIDLNTPESVVGNYFINPSDIGDLKLRVTRSDNGADYDNYALYLDDIKFVGPGGELVIHDFEGVGDPAAFGGTAVTGATAGSTAVRVNNAGKWPNFREPSNLDVSQYETLEFWVKFDLDSESDIAPWVNTVIDGNSPQYSNRWYPHEMNTSHRGELVESHAFEKLQLASTDIEIKDQMGGDNLQRRDMMVMPNGLVWVRDQFTFTESQTAQIGPIWQVQDIVSSGSNWFQTRQDDGLGAYTPDQSLLVYFVDDPQFSVHSETNPTLANHNGVYQKWEGIAQPGSQYTFNTFLLANDPTTTQAWDFITSIETLVSTETATVVRYGDTLMVDNTLRTNQNAGGLETDAEFLYLEHTSSDDVTYAAGLLVDSIVYAGQSVVLASSTLQNFELETSNSQWRSKIGTNSAATVAVYLSETPFAIRTHAGDTVLFSYDSPSQTVLLPLAAGDHSLYSVLDNVWTGIDPNDLWLDTTNWARGVEPDETWRAVLDNLSLAGGMEAVISTDASADSVLVRGTAGTMLMEFESGSTLSAPFGVEVDSGGQISGFGTIDGDYTQLAGGMFGVELNGTDNSDPGNPEFDHLLITGSAVLDGILSVSLGGSYLPSIGEQFEILTAGDLSGMFSLIDTTGMPAGLGVELIYDIDSVILEIVLAGDFNGDGIFDGLDFLAWQRDPSVGDLADWQANFGLSVNAARYSIPEPSVTCLGLIASLVGLLARSRNRINPGSIPHTRNSTQFYSEITKASGNT